MPVRKCGRVTTPDQNHPGNQFGCPDFLGSSAEIKFQQSTSLSKMLYQAQEFSSAMRSALLSGCGRPS